MIQVLHYFHYLVVTGPSSGTANRAPGLAQIAELNPGDLGTNSGKRKLPVAGWREGKKSRWYFRLCCLVSGVFAGLL